MKTEGIAMQRHRPWFFPFLAALLAFLLPMGGAHAQATGARGENFIYRVQAGDILLTLSKRFTSNEENWKQIRQLNGIVDQYRIPIGFQLKIPFSLIDEKPATATVTHLGGTAYLNGLPLNQVGTAVTEGMTITTAPNSHVTLTLPDRSKVLVPADSAVTAQRLRAFSGTDYIDSIFKIDQGGLDSHVNPDGNGVGRFEIRTPVSITGVRGTILRTGVMSGKGAYSAIIKGQADFSQSSDTPITELRNNQGIATDASGQAQGARALLPAPVLTPPNTAANDYTLRFAPVAGASAYQVVIADDREGYDVLWSTRITGTQVTLPRIRNGNVFVLVRSVDEHALSGKDAVLAMQLRQNTIDDGSGSPIRIGDDGYLLRTTQ